ncbi:MAG: hypothetical protein HY271_06990 [Deltaproteobacteria bacterium]|nr:hypothetical protein [Deltaproteobacteria bacterium]
MEHREVERRVAEALDAFEREDSYLLAHDLNERCIAGRIAFHLQLAFPEWSVDVEYNRDGAEPKRLELSDDCANVTDDDGRALVVPDIIVHQRGRDGPNLMGIEIKKAGDRRGVDCDRARIHALQSVLRYRYGALVECETRPGRAHTVEVREWFS